MVNEDIEVMLVDDHELMREGLKQLLELEPGINIVTQAKNGKEAVEEAVAHNPDVVLLDINMPGINGIDVLKRFKDLGIKSKVIMLTIHEEREYLFETMKIGADGYILKDSDSNSLIKAIRDVHVGKSYIQPCLSSMLSDGIDETEEYNEDLDKIKLLTKREYEVLLLIAEGLSNRDIADRLFISEKTVKNHVSNIFKKIKVNDRMKAAIFAFKTNIKKI